MMQPSLADAGIETALEDRLGQELPEFAAFVLLGTEQGRAALREYYRPFVELAVRTGMPLVLDTPTWRANHDWGESLGYDAAALERANRDAAELVRSAAEAIGEEAASGGAPDLAPLELTVGGCVGPRYEDGADSRGRAAPAMGAQEAERYHAPQISALAAGGADRIHAVTMTDAGEAVGIVRAARSVGVPVVVSFAVDGDGRLAGGVSLAEAILVADAETDAYPLGYLVNCAHPSEVVRALAAEAQSDEARGALAERVVGFRLNAARHGEDRGDAPEQFAAAVLDLRALAPAARVFGGCCGTDAPHIAAIAEALRG